jgi:hypothetical protein
LGKRELPILEMAKVDVSIFKCHAVARGPLNFNFRSTGRFSAPNGEYGVTYLGTSQEGAFAERFLQDDLLDKGPDGMPHLDRSSIDRHCLCPIGFTDSSVSLRLVNLTGSLAHLGADGRLAIATDKPALTQSWALALWSHPERPDGLYYPARHDPTRASIALFDRAGDFLVGDCSTNALRDNVQLGRLLNLYRVALIEDA